MPPSWCARRSRGARRRPVGPAVLPVRAGLHRRPHRVPRPGAGGHCERSSISPPMAEPASTRKRYRAKPWTSASTPCAAGTPRSACAGSPPSSTADRRPWILPDGGDPADVVRVVARCPTGALRTHPPEPAAREQPATPTEVTAVPGGPVLLRGDLHVTGRADSTSTRPAPPSAHAAPRRTRPTATAAGRAETGPIHAAPGDGPMTRSPTIPATAASARTPSTAWASARCSCPARA